MKILFIACLCLFFVGCKSNKSYDKIKEKELLEEFENIVARDTVDTLKASNYYDSIHKKVIPRKKQLLDWNIHGTEPFWSLVASNNEILFLHLTDKIDTIQFYHFINSSVNPLQNTNEHVISFRDSEGNFAKLSIVNEECSDGMSDKQYQYSATFKYKNEVLKGVAEKI